MQDNNKTIAKNTLFMYFRMFFTMCVGLYTSRVVLATLGFIDYGLYNVIGGVIAMLGFLNGAMINSISRFLTFELGGNNAEKLKKVFSMSILIQLLLGGIILLLGETIGLWFFYNKLIIPPERLFASECVYHLSVLSAFLVIINVPYNAIVIAHEKMSVFAYLSIMDVCFKLLVVYLLVITQFDRLILYAVLLFGIQLFGLLAYRWYAMKNFSETSTSLVWDKKMFYEMFGYAGWSTIGNFFFLFYTQGVNLILNMFCGPVVNAARGIAVQVESVVKQFSGNIQTAINPQIIKSYASKDMQRMYYLMYASSRLCFFLLFLIVTPIIFQVSVILNLWLGNYPDYAEIFIILTIINCLIETLVNPLFTANLASGKIKIYHVINSINSTLFIPIIYLSLKYTLLPEIVFYCIIITNTIGFVVKIFIIKYQINLNVREYFTNVILRILPVVAISITLVFFIKPILHHGFWGLIETILFSSILIMSTIYYWGVTPNERQSLIAIINKNIIKRYCK